MSKIKTYLDKKRKRRRTKRKLGNKSRQINRTNLVSAKRRLKRLLKKIDKNELKGTDKKENLAAKDKEEKIIDENKEEKNNKKPLKKEAKKEAKKDSKVKNKKA